MSIDDVASDIAQPSHPGGLLRTSTGRAIGATLTYLQGECSYRRADSVRRFNVGGVLVLPPPPDLCPCSVPCFGGAERRDGVAGERAGPNHAVQVMVVAQVEIGRKT